MIAWEDLLGVYKIAVCDKVQCNDGAQGLGYKKYIIYWKKIELDSWRSKAVSENKKVQEKCGHQGLCEIQIAMPSIIATKRNHGER